MPAVKAGIAPPLVLEQVKNTAAWLWEDPRAAAVTGALDRVDDATRAQTSGDGAPDYLRHLLAAHFSTVATFVPTDVDARIRHHAWMAIEDHEALAKACDVLDDVATWDARLVSARTVDCKTGDPSQGSISGHDGEWLGVRAGALGRAATLGAKDVVERLVEALDRELAREEQVFVEALSGGAPARRVLSAATVIAHNLGDLSRVVEAWPRQEDTTLRAKYVRLGHPDTLAKRSAFVTAGALNKALLALENHRFLALRKPRGLRTARALLLPIGPWFDAWGESIARHPGIEDRDRAEIVAGLLEIHTSSPEQLGCLRALAGIHRATRGGLELHVPNLPARLRKDAVRGKVREAVDVGPEHFEARIERSFSRLRDVGSGRA
jgi:hypothetical protein